MKCWVWGHLHDRIESYKLKLTHKNSTELSDDLYQKIYHKNSPTNSQNRLNMFVVFFGLFRHAIHAGPMDAPKGLYCFPEGAISFVSSRELVVVVPPLLEGSGCSAWQWWHWRWRVSYNFPSPLSNFKIFGFGANCVFWFNLENNSIINNCSSDS